MFVDNVVTILMMAPVALPLARTAATCGSRDSHDRIRRELHGYRAVNR